ncbi:HD domain-containing protein [Deinococcus multiflagellatus]|uniref:HD domain-containing protein n=1 Tax=Deinococcus multiflagellatus TaxID=1656887 RepID=A0ABW1ZN96_9DEIO
MLALLAEGRPLTFETISAAFTPFVPLLARLPDTPQDPQWHAEGSVAAHSALVVAHAHALADEAGLGGEDRAALLLAAALHDLGKARTTREEPDETGALRIRSRQHARRGRDELAFRLLDAGLRRGLLLKVLALVAEHHSLHRALDGDWSRGVPALARRAPLPLLTRLARADARGRVVLSGDAARGKDTADLLELAAQDLGVWAGATPTPPSGPRWRRCCPGPARTCRRWPQGAAYRTGRRAAFTPPTRRRPACRRPPGTAFLA